MANQVREFTLYILLKKLRRLPPQSAAIGFQHEGQTRPYTPWWVLIV
jgi:hypothetical protein